MHHLLSSPAKAGAQQRRIASIDTPRVTMVENWTPAFAGERGGIA